MEKGTRDFGRRFVFGLIILLVGLVMILHKADLINYELYDILMSWEMLLIGIGALVFFGGSHGAGIIVMSLGVFFMIPDVFREYDEVRKYFWPVILVMLGLVFMIRPKPGFMKKEFRPENKEYGSNNFDEFDLVGAKEVHLKTDDFIGGRATAVFGANEIDLRSCEISPEGATIEVSTVFGAGVMLVPNDWTVINRVTAVFGGYSDVRIKDPNYAPNPSKTIVVKGVCIFGGIEIRNFHK